MTLRLAARLALLPVLWSTAAAFAQGTPPAVTPAAEPAVVAERFIAGFNRHDLGLLIAETDENVKWMTVGGDQLVVDAKGQAAFQEWMAKSLAAFPTLKKTVEQSVAHGPFVSAWERSRWKSKSGDDVTQIVLVVYEVQKGKIKNVWRYAPQP